MTVLCAASFFVWKFRVALFEIPRAWRACQAARTDDALQVAYFDLLKLQDPDLLSLADLRIEELRTRDGSTVQFLCVVRSRTGGAVARRFATRAHYLLDRKGHLVRSDPPFFDQHPEEYVTHRIEPSLGLGPDVIHVADTIERDQPEFQITVDLFGFVPHGYMHVDAGIYAPVRTTLAVVPGEHYLEPWDAPGDDEETEIRRLMAHGRAEDALRALLLMESETQTRFLATRYLRHANSELRARAATVLTGSLPDERTSSSSSPTRRRRYDGRHSPRSISPRRRRADSLMTLTLSCGLRLGSASVAPKMPARRKMRSPIFTRIESAAAWGLATTKNSSAAACAQLLDWVEEELNATKTRHPAQTLAALELELQRIPVEAVRPACRTTTESVQGHATPRSPQDSLPARDARS